MVSVQVGLVVWAGLTLAYNTPWGWVVQDRIGGDLGLVASFAGLARSHWTILDWFKMLGNWIDAAHAVDNGCAIAAAILRVLGDESDSQVTVFPDRMRFPPSICSSDP